MEEPEMSVKKIEVFGPGCARCVETYRIIRHVVEAAGIECEVIKVESIAEMMKLGVMSTPAVALDGKVVLQGRIPSSADVKKLLGLE